MNSFSALSDDGVFARTPEARVMALCDRDFTSSFLKLLQSKLEAALWQFYYSFAEKDDSKNVMVNLAAKKAEVFVKFPIPEELNLMYVGKVTLVKTKTSVPFVKMFGVQFFVDDPQNADILMPAWQCKTVTRADVAYFKLVENTCRVLFVIEKQTNQLSGPPAEASLDDQNLDKLLSRPKACHIQVLMGAETDEGSDPIPSEVRNKSHWVFDGTLSSLVPLPDVEDKVKKEVTLQKQRAEKSAVQLWNHF